MSRPRSETPPGAAARTVDAEASRPGSPLEFEQLFARYAPRVLGYLQRRGLEPTAAEELTQEVMLTVWRKAESYDPARASLATWVFTIARNKHVDLHRRRRRPEPDPEDPCFARPDVAEDARPDTRLAAGERTERVRAALAGLSEEQRETLTLLYFEGRTMAEVAERAGVPLGTVKSRSRRALAALRGELDAAGGGEGDA